MNKAEKEKIEAEVEEKKPELTASEKREVKERGTPRAAVVYETIREEGEFELQRTSSALAWSGLAAGLSMGFSLVAEGLLRHHLPDTDWRPLISKLGYAAGFLIVILGRQQLFTENTLTVILPLLLRRNFETFVCVLRLWGIVFASNVGGALIFAFVVSHTSVFDEEMRRTFTEIGAEAMKGDWTTIFIKAVFAGWLIALMVWLLPAAQSARVWIIIIMTYLVALSELAHIIAGSVEVSFAVMTGAGTWSNFFIDWMIPTLLGNIIGGVSLVAVLAHAQVVNEKNGNTKIRNK